MKITINLDEEEVKILTKRAKSNILTLREQVEDIVRRSCISAKNTKLEGGKSDDAFIEIFSRQKRGRKMKRKNH